MKKAILLFLVGLAYSYDLREGIPSGGKDLCPGVILKSSCYQGYFLDKSKFTGVQFSRLLTSIGSQEDAGAYTQLVNCLAGEKIGSIISKFISENVTNPESLNVMTTIWKGYQPVFQVTGIESTLRDKLKTEIESETALCYDNSISTAYSVGIVIGSIVGVLLLFLCCAGIFYLFIRRRGGFY